MEEEKNNISTEELLDEEDLYIIRQIINIKENLGNFISNKEVNTLMVDIIDKSDIFSFRSERNRKYLHLNRGRPSFILKMDFKKAEEKYKYKFVFMTEKDVFTKDPIATLQDKRFTKDHQMIVDIAHKELIEPFSGKMLEILLDNEKVYEILEDSRKIKVNEELRKNLIIEGMQILSTIFYVIDNLRENNIQITYLM